MGLRSEVVSRLDRLERNFYTTSSCGVCGKASIAALWASGIQPLEPDALTVDAAWLSQLPVQLRHAQSVFDTTGGLHAAALFRAGGQLVTLREDVGRHNAVDKLIGSQLMDNQLDSLRSSVLLLSGSRQL